MAKSKSAAPAASSSVTSRRTSPNRFIAIVILGAIVAGGMGYAMRGSAFFPSGTTTNLLTHGRYNVTCLDNYPTIGKCSPPTSCGRLIVDDFLSSIDVQHLRDMAQVGMSFGSGSGGPTIFDAVSGAASKGEAFQDAYTLMEKQWTKAATAIEKARNAKNPVPQGALTDLSNLILSRAQLDLYRTTTQRIQEVVSKQFGVSNLYLTKPSFFSRITSAVAKTTHDEYWHEHIDKLQYGSFAYTALIYLSDYGTDFTGGEFVFVDKDGADHTVAKSIAHPKKGRMMAFTSGKENIHYVQKVTSGVRYALTIAFTCDKKQSVSEQLFKKAEQLLAKHQQLIDQILLEQRQPPAVEQDHLPPIVATS